MLSKEQIEQIVQMTIDTLRAQEGSSAVQPGMAGTVRTAGNGWMFDDANDCVEAALQSQKELVKLTMEHREKLIQAMRQASRDNARKLAEMAHEETGYGNVPDKVAKYIKENGLYR